jgi:hypothetical protein
VVLEYFIRLRVSWHVQRPLEPFVPVVAGILYGHTQVVFEEEAEDFAVLGAVELFFQDSGFVVTITCCAVGKKVEEDNLVIL